MYNSRTYKTDTVCAFRKTKDRYGGLSNMASGYPIIVNGVKILTSEALYQSCRYPHIPNIQKKIISEKSPMSAKMVGKPFKSQTRSDWEEIKIDIMRWCLRVKLAQNFKIFGLALEETYGKLIVEDSSKDRFWGAIISTTDPTLYEGTNALGRLLMELRKTYNSKDKYSLLIVPKPCIPNFKLYEESITDIDERNSFISYLKSIGSVKLSQDKTPILTYEGQGKLFQDI